MYFIHNLEHISGITPWLGNLQYLGLLEIHELHIPTKI
jgi:hypothetical protein